MLRLLKRANVSIDKLISVYCTKIRPVLEYACQVWHGGLTGGLTKQIESIQIRAMNIIMPDASEELALEIAKIPMLGNRRKDLYKKLFIEMQDVNHKLHHLLPPIKVNTRNLRSDKKYPVPKMLDRTRASFVNWCLYNVQ